MSRPQVVILALALGTGLSLASPHRDRLAHDRAAIRRALEAYAGVDKRGVLLETLPSRFERAMVKRVASEGAAATSTGGPNAASTGQSSATRMPAMIAGIILLIVFLLVVIFIVWRFLRRQAAKGTKEKNVPDGFNPVTYPRQKSFHSKAGSLAVTDKYTSPFADPDPNPNNPARPTISVSSPAHSDIGSPKSHHSTFDPRTLPPTSLARNFPQYSPGEKRPQSPAAELSYADAVKTAAVASPQRRIPVPIIRSRSTSQPPLQDRYPVGPDDADISDESTESGPASSDDDDDDERGPRGSPPRFKSPSFHATALPFSANLTRSSSTMHRGNSESGSVKFGQDDGTRGRRHSKSRSADEKE